jgi:cytochrome d ubiquinol oxidase subunit II
MEIDLPLIWGLLIAVAVLMYVVLDGFDLGVGILFPFVEGERNRDIMMNSVAPVWDGNETWLILGGGGLFAVFPLAYSVTMTALYAPLIAMLLALVFRGVAFEFRFRDRAHKPIWDLSFSLGSIAAAFFQGIMLGAFVQGIAVEGRGYAGGWWDWLTHFSVFTGAAVILGYAMLGAGWLIMKTEGDLQERFYPVMLRLGAVVILAMAVVSLWTPMLNEAIADRWFSWPNLALLSPVPLLVAATAAALYRSIRKRKEWQPFVCALLLFILGYVGFGISLYPKIVPPEITIWEAAAPAVSQGFLLVGTLFLLPLVLGYTAYAYWIFRGKVRTDEGYH